ncbi:MAG: 3-dehydroquinate synthase [Bacteriovoracales bacterium]|nr:3-dehydroquinate synthase [Bacteriovoracales bacterium]
MSSRIASSIVSPVPIQHLPSALKSLETSQIILLCDRHIESLYGNLIDELKEMPGKSVLYQCTSFGEHHKTFDSYQKCIHELLGQGVHRKAHLVAIGGGGLSDFAGFVASTLLRGIDWSIVPTTLLAQVDAAIGGKTAINSPYGKNLIGSFHFPKNIFLCEDFLLTLEEEDRQSGLGEVVKYALLSRTIFDAVMEGKKLRDIISSCAHYKQDIVGQDPYETGARKFLNLGHTFGHAYEFLTKAPHGICVLWGIEYIDKYFLKNKIQKKYTDLLKKLKLHPIFHSIDEKDLLRYITQDKKKISQNEIELVLLEDVGHPYCQTFPMDQLPIPSFHETHTAKN